MINQADLDQAESSIAFEWCEGKVRSRKKKQGKKFINYQKCGNAIP